MEGRKALPITTVLLILAVALATVGVGYGLWSKVLTIEGTVYTGEVNAVLSIEEIDEGDASLVSDDGIDEDDEIEGKDVGDCTAELIDVPPDLDNKGPQLMRITIRNGYPSFSCFVNFNVQNLGTIPIKVDQPVLSGVDPTALDVAFIKGSVGAGGCYYNEVPPGVPVGDVISHPQLEPEEMIFCTIWVHVRQEASQSATYTFVTRILAHQWNEFSGPHDPLLP